ncbi:MAG: RimK family alpha-L-glutamate ligase [Burkholderiales bacterium]|nr:RimK family alpha-L-glutamate ligase [Burkholderiales bacterium]
MNPEICNDEKLIGLARLMKMAFDGINLAPIGDALIARVEKNPLDAEALMDLSTVLQLKFMPEVALDVQSQALDIKTLYHLPASGEEKIRLLAIMAPGNLMTNAPLEFLVEGSDISLYMLYVSPDLQLPPALPEHDLLFVAVGESDRSRPVLEELGRAVKTWPRPVLNLPDNILATSREAAPIRLASLAGVDMPLSVRVERAALEAIGQFPVIARPVDSHAGQGLARIDSPEDIRAYLSARQEQEFFVAKFVEYRSRDGLYRKYRIVLIDGKPYACHMGISEHWMIHYANAGMDESAEKREEEARFMAGFDGDFARRHYDALSGIDERMGLDYLVIDCAETQDGRLLIFEVDIGAVIHAMDPVDVFPYKAPQMRQVFSAFRNMLARAAHEYESA